MLTIIGCITITGGLQPSARIPTTIPTLRLRLRVRVGRMHIRMLTQIQRESNKKVNHNHQYSHRIIRIKNSKIIPAYRMWTLLTIRGSSCHTLTMTAKANTSWRDNNQKYSHSYSHNYHQILHWKIHCLLKITRPLPHSLKISNQFHMPMLILKTRIPKKERGKQVVIEMWVQTCWIDLFKISINCNRLLISRLSPWGLFYKAMLRC